MERSVEDEYLAVALETFFQFMDAAGPWFKNPEDAKTYTELRQRIAPLVSRHRSHRLAAAGVTQGPDHGTRDGLPRHGA